MIEDLRLLLHSAKHVQDMLRQHNAHYLPLEKYLDETIIAKLSKERLKHHIEKAQSVLRELQWDTPRNERRRFTGRAT